MDAPNVDLSQESLEQLCIAVMNLKNSRGLRIALFPRHVLQDWVVQQLPEPVKVDGFNPLPQFKG